MNFNEPLSTLQRLTEDYEYSELLDRAAKCNDPAVQLVYIAAFAVSSYATTSHRTGKPFNPLLGETYECDRRDDLGWRSISEQVNGILRHVVCICGETKLRIKFSVYCNVMAHTTVISVIIVYLCFFCLTSYQIINAWRQFLTRRAKFFICPREAFLSFLVTIENKKNMKE